MTRLRDALASVGAVLMRQGKHLVYRLPNGKKFTTAATPSDVRAERNALSVLRHVMGAVPEHREGTRRVKTRKPGPPRPSDRMTPAMSAIGAAMQQAGVVDAARDARIDDLERVTVSLLRKVEQLRSDIDNIAWLNSPVRCVRIGPWEFRVYRKPRTKEAA